MQTQDNGEQVMAWAREHESGAGEEHERTLELGKLGGYDCVQTWAEYDEEKHLPYVGFWMLSYGVEARWDLTLDQARELAANLLVLANDAELQAYEAAQESD